MDDSIAQQERAYWEREAGTRRTDLRTATERGEPAFRLAGLRLRLDEAERRLRAL